jgi:hypothetical protein
MKKGKIDVVTFLIERAFGKATEHVESNNLETNYMDLPKEQREALLDELMSRYIKKRSGDEKD